MWCCAYQMVACEDEPRSQYVMGSHQEKRHDICMDGSHFQLPQVQEEESRALQRGDEVSN